VLLASFEPALTAPEADPARDSYLPKQILATPDGGRMGEERVWVVPRGELNDQTEETPAPGPSRTDLLTLP